MKNFFSNYLDDLEKPPGFFDRIVVYSPEQVEVFKSGAKPFEYNEPLGIVRGYIKDNKTLITEVMSGWIGWVCPICGKINVPAVRECECGVCEIVGPIKDKEANDKNR